MFDFFKKFIQSNQNNIENATITNSNIIQINGANIDVESLAKELEKPQKFSDELLNDLMKSKLVNYRNLLLRGRFITLKAELDDIFKKDLTSLERNTKVQVCFYRFCQAFCSGDITDYEFAEKFLIGKYLEEAKWLKGFCNSEKINVKDEFELHLPEIQSVLLQHLFIKQQFSILINLLDSTINNIDEAIQEEIQFYAGLSYFNTGDYLSASNILDELCNDSNQLHYRFFAAIAVIHKYNKYYIDNRDDTHIEQALQVLKEMKSDNIYEKNAELVASTELIGYFNLGKSSVFYADEGIKRYLSYHFSLRKIPVIKHLYGLLYEVKHDYENAIEVYLSMDWKNDQSVAHRLFACYINVQEYENIIERFEQLETKDNKTQGLYLLALKLKGDNGIFRKKLIEAVNLYGDSFSNLYYIAIIVEDKTDFKDIVEKQLHRMLDSGETFKGLGIQLLTGYAHIFAHFGDIKLLSHVVSEIDKLSNLVDETIGEIYNGIYLLLQKCDKEENNFDIPDDVEIAEKLIDRFLAEKIDESNFIWLKIICQKISRKEYSILQYLTKLFDMTHDINVAADILLLQYKQNKYDDKLYEYLQAVQQSSTAGHIMVAATTYQHLGRYNEADFFSYKALYVMNDKDDFDIYQKYLLLHFNNIGHVDIPVTLKEANEKCVFCLVSEFEGEEREWIICLDGEVELNDDNNKSLGIDHLNRNNRNFAKLSVCSCSQIVNIDGKKYTVKEIMTRSVYAFRFVLSKVRQYPEKFEGVFWSIPVNDTVNFIEQIESLFSNSNHIDDLLDFYISNSLNPRAPIDFLLRGDYKNYFATIVKLLYTPDMALYSGNTVIETNLDDQYVITLSTLAIIVLMGWIKLLDPIKDRLICPESYIPFFKKLNAEEINYLKISPGIIGRTSEQKIVFVENDSRIPELWEKILELCEGFKQVSVTDEERISYRIIEELTGEQLITGLNIDKIQLDSLIIASKTNATYLCDDLFFRRIARSHNLKELNFTSFLYHFIDSNTAVEVIKKLSETNYIFTPFIYRNIEEARMIANNLMSGKIKSKIYGSFFDKYLGYTKSFFCEKAQNGMKGNIL